jgi:CheY-like chemotaxis protein
MITPSTGDKQRTIIDRQARHLSRLVDDLLDVARVTTGKVTLQLAHVELGDIIRRCVQGAELSARAHSIRLRATIDATPMGVLGDAVRLEEIVNNLVTNAIKYSPAHSTVDITGHCDGTDCVVVIRDRGIGLAPEMLPRVFDLFAQAESSLARSQGGLGIGLTLVRALAELHHGTVTASSPGLGQGSTFEVRLPHHPATVEHAPQPPAASAASARIVLVDDNIDILEMTCELLQRYGCEVITASDGNTGIAAITEHAPDIAIVDIGLPGTDGYEVARTIRASGTRPYLVALTGYGQRSDRERALAAGFDEHLIKPIDFERLRTLISQHARDQRGTIAT